jgi:hypothetical protein
MGSAEKPAKIFPEYLQLPKTVFIACNDELSATLYQCPPIDLMD